MMSLSRLMHSPKGREVRLILADDLLEGRSDYIKISPFSSFLGEVRKW